MFVVAVDYCNVGTLVYSLLHTVKIQCIRRESKIIIMGVCWPPPQEVRNARTYYIRVYNMVFGTLFPLF